MQGPPNYCAQMQLLYSPPPGNHHGSLSKDRWASYDNYRVPTNASMWVILKKLLWEIVLATWAPLARRSHVTGEDARGSDSAELHFSSVSAKKLANRFGLMG